MSDTPTTTSSLAPVTNLPPSGVDKWVRHPDYPNKIIGKVWQARRSGGHWHYAVFSKATTLSNAENNEKKLTASQARCSGYATAKFRCEIAFKNLKGNHKQTKLLRKGVTES